MSRVSHRSAETRDLIERCRPVLVRHPGVRLAWLFGSASRGRMMADSDVDVGVLASPDFGPAERRALWRDLSEALGREVDLVVLSPETNPALAADVVNGVPVLAGDGDDLLELTLAKTRAAEDWERFVVGFYRERQRSRGHREMQGGAPALSPSQRDSLIRRMDFCRQELKDLEDYRTLTLERYQADRSARRNVERIAETVANAVIDMAKTLVAASEAPVPQSYAAALRSLGALGIVPPELADRLTALAELRNALAHQYLDLKWASIKEFIETGSRDVRELLTLLERLVVPDAPPEADPGQPAGSVPSMDEGP